MFKISESRSVLKRWGVKAVSAALIPASMVVAGQGGYNNSFTSADIADTAIDIVVEGGVQVKAFIALIVIVAILSGLLVKFRRMRG